MKQRYVNLICFVLALLSGILTFSLKYHVLDKEKQLKKIYSDITQNQKEMHGLKTDWASLTNPEDLRIQAKQIRAKPIRAEQIIHIHQLAEKPVPIPPKKPEFKEDDNDF